MSSDELLLQKMQIAQYNDNERAQKIKASNKVTRRANLSTVEMSSEDSDPLSTTAVAKPNKPIKENSLFTKMEESNTAIRELTGQVESLLQTGKTVDDDQTKTPANAFKRPRRQCVACQQDKKDCNHCFKCGSDTHWARGCRAGGRLKTLVN